MPTRKRQRMRLSELIDRGLLQIGDSLVAGYKGKEYQATAVENGIKYRGRIYPTPAAAGRAVTANTTCDGWMFWKIRDKRTGKLVRLAEARRALTGSIRQYRKQRGKKSVWIG